MHDLSRRARFVPSFASVRVLTGEHCGGQLWFCFLKHAMSWTCQLWVAGRDSDTCKLSLACSSYMSSEALLWLLARGAASGILLLLCWRTILRVERLD